VRSFTGGCVVVVGGSVVGVTPSFNTVWVLGVMGAAAPVLSLPNNAATPLYAA
jgi:hypothetical protein